MGKGAGAGAGRDALRDGGVELLVGVEEVGAPGGDPGVVLCGAEAEDAPGAGRGDVCARERRVRGLCELVHASGGAHQRIASREARGGAKGETDLKAFLKELRRLA